MTRVVVIHAHPGEGAEHVSRLRRAGFEARYLALEGAPSLRALRDDRPDAVVIDLTRLPSQGRHVAVHLRQQKWARSIPLVLAGGAEAKIAALRELLPDARFAPWRRIRSAIRAAIAEPVAEPVVPSSIGGYSGTPLPVKLGIKPGSTVRVLRAPKGLAATLGALPEGARLATRGSTPAARVLLFAHSRAELTEHFVAATKLLADGGTLWIAWPKQTSALAGDLTQAHVRAFGLERDLVDYKICAIDADWSGLAFARRKPR